MIWIREQKKIAESGRPWMPPGGGIRSKRCVVLPGWQCLPGTTFDAGTSRSQGCPDFFERERESPGLLLLRGALHTTEGTYMYARANMLLVLLAGRSKHLKRPRLHTYSTPSRAKVKLKQARNSAPTLLATLLHSAGLPAHARAVKPLKLVVGVYIDTCAHLRRVFYALLLYAFLRHVLVVEDLCTGVDDSTLLHAFWNLQGLEGASVPRNRKKGKGKRSCVRLYFTLLEDASQALKALQRSEDVRVLFPVLQVEFHSEPHHLPAEPQYRTAPKAGEPVGLHVQLESPYTVPLERLVQHHQESISKQKKARKQEEVA